MTLTHELSQRLLRTTYEDIPGEAVEVARQVCLDGLAVMIAALGEPEGIGRLTLDYIRAQGGAAQSSVIGMDRKTSVQNAAYANGTLGHALDFDNTWWPLNHPTSPTLPAIMAIAERDRLKGTAVIRAIVLAFEVQGRMRLASAKVEAGTRFHKPGVSGIIGATAGAGALLGLDVDGFCRAFGIAGSRAGSMSANTGTMTKSSHSGHAARMGVEAATLAKLGWTANRDIFGQGGFFDLFYEPGYSQPDLLVQNFGAPWRMIDPGVGFKKHPCNYFTHRPIDAALALQQREDLEPDQIASVTVDFPRFDYVNRPKPRSGLDGKFSIQYTTTIALLDRRIRIESFSDQRLNATDVRSLLPRVTLNIRDDIPRDFQETWAAVNVTTTDGRVLEQRCDKPRGLWGVPLTREERHAKVRMCTEKALTPGETDELIELVEGLDRRNDVARIMAICARARTDTKEHMT